jgi:hypothetical protein
METDFSIPINTFAEYFEATDSRRITLLKEQLRSIAKQNLKVVGKTTSAVYGNTAKAQIRETILSGLNHSLTDAKLKEVMALKPDEPWPQTDQKVNIAVLERFKKMSFPKALIGKKLEKVLPEHKIMPFYGIRIKIVPTLIFRVEIGGKMHLGACMVHSSKKHPFSGVESKIVATLLSQFLSYCVLKEDEIVNPELCLCIDTYAGTVINSNNQFPSDIKNVKKVCSELPKNLSIAEQSLAA